MQFHLLIRLFGYASLSVAKSRLLSVASLGEGLV